MKYMGSKSKISKELVPIINDIIKIKDIDTYIEPFVGGANMIDKIKCKNRIGLDNNEYLISMWKDIQNDWIPPLQMSRELYNDIKDNKSKYDKSLVAIAGFCATYNAKWFGGYAGIVNTKIGTQRNYYDESVRNILKQKDNIKDVKFVFGDYTYFNDYKNCLIYCDPPYKNTTQYGTSKDFNYDKFHQWCRDMSVHNVVLISEYDMPDDFTCIWEKELTTTLDKNSRSKRIEKLFTYCNK